MQRAFGLDIPQTLDDVCDPTRLALSVYDMQVGIVNQIENGQQITDRVFQVLDAARAAGVRVFFTRHMSLPKELMGTSQFRMAMAWQRVKSPDEVKPWFLRDSPGFQLVAELNPLSSEAIFDKLSMSAFEGTPLNMALRDCEIDAFAIVGIAMEIDIDPTVRHGADLGYVPVVVKDACGFGHRDAATHSLSSLEFAGDALFTNVFRAYFSSATAPTTLHLFLKNRTNHISSRRFAVRCVDAGPKQANGWGLLSTTISYARSLLDRERLTMSA